MVRYIAPLAASIIILAAIYAGCVETPLDKGAKVVIYHAGSLAEPFRQLESRFEASHSGVDVRREASGSVDAIRKITDLGKKADVLASADYTLIRDLMIPNYAEWCIMFASNSIVLAYTEDSIYHEKLTEENWPEVLGEGGVRIGFSNPNSDPCGYRALMALKLTEIYHNRTALFDKLIVRHSAIVEWSKGDRYYIGAPQDLEPDSTLLVRPKETDLIPLLLSGDVDYILVYRTLAVAYMSSGVGYIPLWNDVDLSQIGLKETYAVVSVVQGYGGGNGNEHTVEATPIVYGVSIPTCAENRAMAVEFVSLLLSDEGQSTMEESGFIVPERYSAINPESVDDKLRSYL